MSKSTLSIWEKSFILFDIHPSPAALVYNVQYMNVLFEAPEQKNTEETFLRKRFLVIRWCKRAHVRRPPSRYFSISVSLFVYYLYHWYLLFLVNITGYFLDDRLLRTISRERVSQIYTFIYLKMKLSLLNPSRLFLMT